MEHILHSHFADRRDGMSEWFKVSFEEVAAFMNSPQKFNVQQVSFDEVKLINTKFREPITASERASYEEEEALQKEKLENPFREKDSLYEKFLRVFLPGKLPRRVQIELWNVFQKICATPERLMYRAIVQWPTGVGKTIATLMLIVIASERCKRRGEFYRGLFVSPKNDILDTISKDFNRLSEFGIAVYDGSHGKMSSLTIPTNCHILISACQASLINEKGMRRLPHMTHVHYDEVHRITGDLYFQLLKEMLVKWQTEILTGTSATPKTCSRSQHEKLAELFGDPYTLLHKCDVDEAVKEGWIAKPRYLVSVTPKNDDRTAELDAYLTSMNTAIQKRKTQGLWSGGKVISFTAESVEDAIYCATHAKEFIPGAEVYVANGDRTDDAFIKAPADGMIRILFACQRFREGSDVKGLEMTCALVGNTTAVYILLQMCGRALRLDYEGKEGWCLIVRPSEAGTTKEDVLDSISISEFS
jgi:superfamily II DNA or RNA helicase